MDHLKMTIVIYFKCLHAFLSLIAQEQNTVVSLSMYFMQILRRYHWNIRERILESQIFQTDDSLRVGQQSLHS